MRFLHLSDPHFRKDYQTNEFTAPLFAKFEDPTQRLQRVLAELASEDFDFILITGDLVHEGEIADYQVLKELLEENFKGTPYFFCRGNHDRRPAFFEGLKVEANAEQEYSSCQMIDGLRIIILDSAQDDNHEGKISALQLDQLRRWLAEPAEKGTILLLHHPLAWEEAGIATETPDGFEELIRGSDILGIFVGHIHQSSFAYYQGKPQFMAEALSFGVDEYPGESLFTDRTGYSIFYLKDKELFRYNHLVTPKQSLVGKLAKPIIGNQ